jgi:hypothetical protein
LGGTESASDSSSERSDSEDHLIALDLPGVPAGTKGMASGDRGAGPFPLEEEAAWVVEEVGLVAGGAGVAAGGLGVGTRVAISPTGLRSKT